MKIQLCVCLVTKSDQNPKKLRIESAPWIRIRMELKIWTWTETNLDPKHCLKLLRQRSTGTVCCSPNIVILLLVLVVVTRKDPDTDSKHYLCSVLHVF